MLEGKWLVPSALPMIIHSDNPCSSESANDRLFQSRPPKRARMVPNANANTGSGAMKVMESAGEDGETLEEEV